MLTPGSCNVSHQLTTPVDLYIRCDSLSLETLTAQHVGLGVPILTQSTDLTTWSTTPLEKIFGYIHV